MLNTMEMDRYIRATAARGDLRVVWENTDRPRTDGKTIWLPRLGTDAPTETYNKVRHFATQEVARNLFSSFNGPWQHVTPDQSLLGAIHAATEGYRAERLAIDGYEGDRQIGNNVRPELLKSALKNIDAAPQDVQDQVLPLVAWGNKRWSDVYPSCVGVQEEAERRMSPAAKARYEQLCSGKYDAMLDKARDLTNPDKGTAATYDVAKAIFEDVYKGDAKKEEERCEKQSKSKGGKRGAGDGGDDPSDGEGDAKGQPDKGKGQPGKGEGEGEKRKEKVKCDYSQLMPDAAPPRGETWTPLHAHIEDTYSGTGQYTPATPDNYRVYDYTKHRSDGSGSYTKSIDDALAHTSAGFAHKVRTIIQVRDRDRYHYGLKRGRLNVGSMHRIVVKDAPGYNERVFKRREVNDVLDAAVTLLVDQSGSMGGNKFIHAAAAATMLNNVFGNVLHIPVEIASFSTGGHECTTIVLHRQFKDKLVDPRDLTSRFAKGASTPGMGGNADGDAVMWAFDRLVMRPEKRKLLIVFSDGQPTDGQGDPDWYLRHVVKEIEQRSPVSIVGIGLQNRSVQRYYKEHQVITNVNHLEEALLNVIEGKLK
jgi:hypothetical protein